MVYAQTNYPQIQGIDGKYTIHDIGCFITAFCNLESDYGKQINPPNLNDFFRDNNIYIDVDDGIRDDVDWSFVQRWDPETRVVQLGNGGWPQSNQAIVKFVYTSPRTGQRTTHFCKVFDYTNQLILDSWDGQVKHISSTVYGQPVAWAIYQHAPVQSVEAPVAPIPRFTVIETYPQGKQVKLNKQPTHLWGMNYDFSTMQQHPIETHNAGEIWTVTNKVRHSDGMDYYRREGQVDGFNVNDCDDYVAPPPPKPPAAPQVINTPNVPVPKVERYPVITKLMVFATAADAKGRRNYSGEDIEPDSYIVIQKDEQAYLVSKDNRTDIGWINTYDNVIKPAEVLQPAVQPTLPVDAPATDINLPTDTHLPVPIADVAPVKKYFYINSDQQQRNYRYTGLAKTTVQELDGRHVPLPLEPGWSGDCTFFAMVDGQPYYIADGLLDTPDKWHFGIDKNVLAEVHYNPLDFNHDSKVDPNDIRTVWTNYVETPLSRGYMLIKDIIPAVKAVQSSERLTQLKKGVIDGITKRKAK